MKDTIRRTIHPEVKMVSEAEGIVDYIASDETIDHYHEIVRADGWRFTHFRKNSPLLDSHQSYTIGTQVGRILSAEVMGKQLVERAQWAIDVPSNELARLGFQMTMKGYLKAVSVGFYPLRAVRPHDGEPFREVVQDLGLSGEAAALVRRIYLEQEQVELSACVLGANPNALLKAYESGDVAEEQLARCGFAGEEEFDFLEKAAAACENEACNDAMRAMMALEMRMIYGRRTATRTFPRKRSDPAPTGPTPSTRGAGDDAKDRARAARRRTLLEKMEKLVNK